MLCEIKHKQVISHISAIMNNCGRYCFFHVRLQLTQYLQGIATLFCSGMIIALVKLKNRY